MNKKSSSRKNSENLIAILSKYETSKKQALPVFKYTQVFNEKPKLVTVHRVMLETITECLNVNLKILNKNEIQRRRNETYIAKKTKFFLGKLVNDENKVLEMFRETLDSYKLKIKQFEEENLANIEYLIEKYKKQLKPLFFNRLRSYKKPPVIIPKVLGIFFELLQIKTAEELDKGS